MDKEQQAIVDEFELFDTWADKYQYIIEQGQKLPNFPESAKTEENFVKGCQSQVWFQSTIEDNHMQLIGMSDSSIVHGLIALLIRIFNNKTCEDILNTQLEFMQVIGLEKHLSVQRNNGLFAMLQYIKARAEEHRYDNQSISTE